jgi:ferredoxin
VKERFDPDNTLNPGKIVHPPKMDDRSLFRYAPGYKVADIKTVMDWSAYPGAAAASSGAVEMCNNNGACRKLEGGVMCPSYRATRNEKDVTRGREYAAARDLRPARSDALSSDSMMETMKLCVSCKACRHECPTGVDMAKMKIEVGRTRRKHGLTLRDRLVGYLPHYAGLASRFPWARQSA